MFDLSRHTKLKLTWNTTLFFQIVVNDKHTYEFLYRLHPLDRFQTLVAEGDLELNHVQFL